MNHTCGPSETLSSGRQSIAYSGRAFLGNAAWARDVSDTTLDALWAATSIRDLGAGEVLCRQGEHATHWFGIMSGLLRQNSLCEDGTSTSLSADGTGEWFGEGALLQCQPRRYEISAMRDSRVACVGAAAFRRAFDEDCGFNRAIARQLSARLSYFIDLFADQRRLDLERGLARILLSLVGHGRPGSTTHVDVTQQELAELAGVSRQRVSRALHRLKGRGLLELSYSSISVLDLPRLAADC